MGETAVAGAMTRVGDQGHDQETGYESGSGTGGENAAGPGIEKGNAIQTVIEAAHGKEMGGEGEMGRGGIGNGP